MRKNKIPINNDVRVKALALAMTDKLGSDDKYNGALNRSIKGTIGLYETSQATFPARDSFLYMTGLKKNHACKAMGITC